MLKDIISELVDVLKKEAEIYNELLSLSSEKTDIIIKGKVSELDSMVKSEQSLILRLGGFEGQRELIVDKIAQLMKVNPKNISMSELVKKLEPIQAKQLKSCQDNLTAVIDKLKGLNDLNSQLVKNSLEYINFSINVIAGAGETGNNYSNTAQVNIPGKRQIFDMKL